MTSTSFRVVPLPTSVAERARSTAATGAPDHKIVTVEAEDSAPCRHCLRWAKPGERVILFPYQTVPAERPYGESGPIFVHLDACDRYARPNEFPSAFRNGRVLRAYNAQDEIVAAEVASDQPEEVAARMFENPAVESLQVRSAAHGCYTFQLERA